MKIISSLFDKAWLVESTRHIDDRGYFGRIFCETEFNKNQLKTNFPQISLSSNKYAGTLRGLHYQIPPFAEAKFIKCIRGEIVDIIIDIKYNSPTFGQWKSCTLSEDNELGLYLSPGYAHGFITTKDDTKILYLISQQFTPGAARAIRWNDSDLNINWPSQPRKMSEKDANAETFKFAQTELKLIKNW